MTRHLSEEALLQVAETGALHPHVEECDACRRRVEGLRDAITDVRRVTVPEPSPLFWDHLSARIQEGIGSAPAGASQPGGGGSAARLVRRFVYAAAVLLIVAVGVWRIESARPGHHTRASRAGAAVRPLTQSDETAVDPAEPGTDDASWQLVTDVGTTVDLDTATEAAGMSLQPGAAERAALQMSPDEQRELVRLLQAAVEQPE